MNFIITWIVYYMAIMFAMCVDNIFWITASPEWPELKRSSLRTKINYVFDYRIKTVITNKRDIVPAIITSLILTIIFRSVI